MIAAFERGQNGVPRKIICPDFGTSIPNSAARNFRQISFMKLTVSRRYFGPSPGKTKNDVERGDYTCLYATLRRLIDVAENLEILVRQLHHGGKGSFDTLTDLM
jgi:hypothetical protein